MKREGKPDSEPKPRREGKTRLHGRPLDDDGAIELAVERVQPSAEPDSEPKPPTCAVCGKKTDWLCADCAISHGKKVAICESPECRMEHEKTHPEVEHV